ncbi:uncharacterized protein LOC119446358 isoform X2 [Dermacentor silvarum]|uniref:uncharacterized protein LOC119446358 isoform X2 n=1 Tax=Dermacentor silvarum TaxID=543639 RepID=UPI0021015B30|nr:uncharacterized protein LOC119446358 isoform X2 [Dermacentor silvarum]
MTHLYKSYARRSSNGCTVNMTTCFLKQCTSPRLCGTQLEIRYKTYSNVVGKIKKNASRLNAVELVIQMGSDRRKTVRGYPRMEIPGLITYVEGHIGMWLGLSILAISSGRRQVSPKSCAALVLNQVNES